ncbi:hypothetical protein [Bradyrhizobium sp. 188]|uniref:hypothetical protein n=1 Tax=Bradyrhizobium sp. 188 TaxID=2782656 RepID=UPI001FF70BCE|nr:hypothetical protein [Bradyrhizobium sp. 188]MCK1497012.1 hypothetical protein [Bradyrhizobium sp. 188]
MLTTITSALPRAQVDPENVHASSSPQVMELQERKLRQRFALAPATARMLADIAFAVEARS